MKVIEGNARTVLATLPEESFHCCITSPPYWGGLRDYGEAEQIGMEREPEAYVERIVGVFDEVRRVLRPDGVLFLNIGDTYAASGKGGGGSLKRRKSWQTIVTRKGFRMPPAGYKMKDLTLTPFQVADALRASGWYLRSTIIWEKPASCEPPRLDRPCTNHEYVFMFAKSEIYAAHNPNQPWWGRTVWRIGWDSSGDHPACMPVELARRCLLIGTREGESVIDPFCGSGTTGLAATRYARDFTGIELSPEYSAMARERINGDMPLFEATA